MLHNKLGVFTHFPRNGTRPSLLDLTWSCFQNCRLFSSWHAPADTGHGSDHTSTYSILNIVRPTFTPRRPFAKCTWSIFSDTIKAANPPGPPSSADLDLELSSFVQKLPEKAIDASTPWSTLGKRSAPWWNTQRTVLRHHLYWAERQARRTPVPVGAAEMLFFLRREFKHAIRSARFCSGTTQRAKTTAPPPGNSCFRLPSLSPNLPSRTSEVTAPSQTNAKP